MKKPLLFAFILGFVATQISSCKKCYTCDFGNNDIREFCSKDFPDGNAGLKLTIDAYEDQGYECQEK